MINPIDDDNKCFQYAATIAIKHKEIEKKLQKNKKWSLL